MYALITDGSITKHLSGNRGIQVGDIKYARDIYSKWTEAERNAIGLFEIIWDNDNKKDEEYYSNTNQTYTYDADAGTVTATYGDATARAHADTTWSQQDSDDGDLPSDKSVGDVKVEGLKTQHKRIIKQQASGLLTDTDWYVIKATDVESYSVPSAITTYRATVRTKSNDMEVLIDACSTVDELAALYVYTDGTRPLGEFPEAV